MDEKTPSQGSKETIHHNEGENADIPDEIEGVLSKLPGPERENMTRIIAAGFSFLSLSSPEGEVAKKITPEHITTILDQQEKGMDYTYKEGLQKKIFFVVILVIIILAVIAIIALLKDENPDIMYQILTVLISASLGAAGGYGIGIGKRNDE